MTPKPTLLILGSNSDVAKACAQRFASEGFELWLASRQCQAEQTALIEAIEKQYGQTVRHFVFDALAYDSHASLVAQRPALPDVVLVAFGYLGDQVNAQKAFAEAQKIIDSNFTGAVSILHHLVEPMFRRGSGSIIGISSVAGERGRQSNYFYGAAKAAWTAYLSGLRQRGQAHGVPVLTVLPGFIRSKMIAHLSTPDLLTASPEEVAQAIWKAYRRKKNRVYVRAWWRPIMWIIRHLPEAIFKRIKL